MRGARALGAALGSLAVIAALAGVTVAQAQQRSAGRAAHKPPADAGASPFGRGGAQAAPAAVAAPASAGGTDAGLVEAKTLDGGTRVFKFKELDIEGRLKSPQLVYFLRRVRAEFGAEDLGHRSFMREMSETRKEPTF
jgi:hypothetical protein